MLKIATFIEYFKDFCTTKEILVVDHSFDIIMVLSGPNFSLII
jgi:hypothetical protein